MVFSLAEVPLPVVLRPTAPFDDDALLHFCAANEGVQIERNPDGELIVMTPAGGKTSNREGYLFRELDLWVEHGGGGVAFSANAGFLLRDGSMRSPDAAWIPSAEWEALSAEQQDKFLPLCPAFIIELRSPSDSVAALEAKMADWIANGVKLGWLLDPERSLAAIYRPGREPEMLLRPEWIEGEGPVAGFRLKMQRVWR